MHLLMWEISQRKGSKFWNRIWRGDSWISWYWRIAVIRSRIELKTSWIRTIRLFKILGWRWARCLRRAKCLFMPDQQQTDSRNHKTNINPKPLETTNQTKSANFPNLALSPRPPATNSNSSTKPPSNNSTTSWKNSTRKTGVSGSKPSKISKCLSTRTRASSRNSTASSTYSLNLWPTTISKWS